MIQKKKNLLLAKNSVSALAVCLATCSAPIDSSFAAGKRDHGIALGDNAGANRPAKRARLIDENLVVEGVTKIFNSSLSQLRQAKEAKDSDMQLEAINTLKSVANSKFHPGAEYLYGVFLRQGTSGCIEDPISALRYFNNPAANGDAESIYETGLCYKRLGKNIEAKESFRQVQENHHLARVEYGALLYDEAAQLPQELKIGRKNEALRLLESVSTYPEAAHKLGMIYCYDEELKNLERGIIMFARAENELVTQAQADEFGIYELCPNEVIVNKRKKEDVGFEIAKMEVEVLKKNGGENLANHLKAQRPTIRRIKERLNKIKQNNRYKTNAENLESYIDQYKGLREWFLDW